jgi:hypothetical protein
MGGSDWHGFGVIGYGYAQAGCIYWINVERHIGALFWIAWVGPGAEVIRVASSLIKRFTYR